MAMKFRFGRLAAAMGIGALIEALLFVGGIVIASTIKDAYGERIFALTQEPAYHLVGWVWQMQRHGFEEQVGFIILVPLLQWVFWSAISFCVLSRRARATAPL